MSGSDELFEKAKRVFNQKKDRKEEAASELGFTDSDTAEKIRKAKELASEQKKDEKAKVARKHIVQSDETLSHIALKYYGSAIKEKWMIIYEANKDVIGDNPNIIRPGMELIIPEIEK